MKALVRTASFKADFHKISRSGKYKIDDLLVVLDYLLKDNPLPNKYKDHKLTGNWSDHRECHIKPDWLLIYRTTHEEVTWCALVAIRNYFKPNQH